MQPSAIPFVVYPVRDVARAREFYQRVFSLVETANWENHWIEFDIGAGTLALTDGFTHLTPGGSGAMVALELPDLEAFGRHLAALGLKWSVGPFDTPVCTSGTIKDPDGNEIMIHRRKP